MGDLICDETGKVMWEAKGEAAALASKVDITLDASPIGGLNRGSTGANCPFDPTAIKMLMISKLFRFN